MNLSRTEILLVTLVVGLILSCLALYAKRNVYGKLEIQ